MRHPARVLPYDMLRAELDARVAAGVLARSSEGPLDLYIYANRCVYERLWDDVSVLARGLVLDREARVVRATPFPKFFNYGENGAPLPDEPFDVYEKLDGSLGIAFHDGARWRVVTKGSFDSTQARWAEAWLATRRLDLLDAGTTWLFEILFPENRIVVRYDHAGLVLLGGYRRDGTELARPEIVATAGVLDARVARTFACASLRELVATCEAMDAQQEGFVVRFASGLRLKLKGAAYRRIHALISNVTPLGLWRALEAGDDLDAHRREIPEEFWGDFDTIRRLLEARIAALTARIERAHGTWAARSDRELGLALAEVDPAVRPFLFGRRKAGPRWLDDPRLRRAVLKEIRPVGNELPGYAPSTLLLGAKEL